MSDVSVVLGDNTSRFLRIWRGRGPPCWQPCHGESQGRCLFGIQIRPQSAQVVRVDPNTQNLINRRSVSVFFSLSLLSHLSTIFFHRRFWEHIRTLPREGLYWVLHPRRPPRPTEIQTSLIMMREWILQHSVEASPTDAVVLRQLLRY